LSATVEQAADTRTGMRGVIHRYHLAGTFSVVAGLLI